MFLLKYNKEYTEKNLKNQKIINKNLCDKDVKTKNTNKNNEKGKALINKLTEIKNKYEDLFTPSPRIKYCKVEKCEINTITSEKVIKRETKFHNCYKKKLGLN